jgi:DNA-binding transcriptional ArsR family regulator
MPSSQESELLRQLKTFRILKYLAKKDQTWTELLEQTKVSPRTLSKHLQELQVEGWVKKKFDYSHVNKGEAKRIHPDAVYSLVRSMYRSAIMETVRQVEDYEDITSKIEHFTDLFLSTNKRVQYKTIRDYFTALSWAIVYVTETEMLRKRTNLYDDSFVTNEASHTLQKILLKQEFQSRMKHQLISDLEEERQENYKRLERAINKLEKKRHK